jgi:hypothetical protein
MRNKILALLLFTATACTGPAEKNTVPENELDAARQFIRAALDGRFEIARDVLLTDSLNNNYLDLAERSYQKMSAADKENYKGSSIVIHQTTTLNDSATVLIFSNSFKNERDTIQVVKKEGKWLVDLKYLFGHGRNENKSASALPAAPTTDTTR